VKLFRELFRGRDNVYAVHWEGRNGKAGYSPAYHHVLRIQAQKRLQKPKAYFPLSEQVIYDHLTGKPTAGVHRLF
jgi:hypothetical protein